MDDKTLVETVEPDGTTFWDRPEATQHDMNYSGWTYLPEHAELYGEEDDFALPIAFPRTLKAARQILKEAGWTIVKNGESA